MAEDPQMMSVMFGRDRRGGAEGGCRTFAAKGKAQALTDPGNALTRSDCWILCKAYQ